MREWQRNALLGMVVAGLLLGAPALGSVPGAGRPAAQVAADGELPDPDPTCSTDIARRYVAGGDGVVNPAKDTDEEKSSKTDRYPDILLKKLQEKHPGPWCEFNTMDEVAGTSDMTVTTDEYQDDGNPTQQSQAHSLRPHLITLTLGRDNTGILQHVTTCMDQIRDHNFLAANACALAVLAAEPAWGEKLEQDLADILGKYKTQMDGNPNLVVAVTGYFNPYPQATDVLTHIFSLCTDLVDTIPTCTARWVQLPPALVTLDQIVKRLNTRIEGVVDQFETGTQGHYFFVNPYDKFKSHCMTFNVKIFTTVYHPPSTVDTHNSDEDMGCGTTWIEDDGDTSTMLPSYLPPAATGVLLTFTQITTKLGLYPNDKGHKCIASLIYEAKTANGLLLKNKLGIAEESKDPEDC